MASVAAARSRPLFSVSAVRRWARANGIAVGERGRIPADVVEQYLAQLRRRNAPG